MIVLSGHGSVTLRVVSEAWNLNCLDVKPA